MNKKVVLFLNGETPSNIPDLTIYKEIFCTDGAYLYLKKLNIVPDKISGDFDSIQIDQLEISRKTKIIATPNQNFTDFEKALQLIIDDGYDTVDVFGASGKQQDHFLGNMNAAYKFKKYLKITFYDNYSTYYFLDKKCQITNVLNKTISLFPFPEANGITTEGLLYPLKNESLSILDRIGTRNKAIKNEILIHFKSGELIVFIIK